MIKSFWEDMNNEISLLLTLYIKKRLMQWRHVFFKLSYEFNYE